jgi:hypothetical protein
LERMARTAMPSINTSTPSLPRLRENLLDLTVAIDDALDTLDPADPIAVAHLADLACDYRETLAALAVHELRAVAR